MSNVIDVIGTARFAKLFDSNMDKGSSKEDGAKYDYPPAYTIQLIVDQSELAKVTRMCPDIKPTVTEDGLEIKFRRNATNAVNPNWGGPPVVKDADGNLWDNSVMIGNDSKVRVAAEVYSHKFGKSARLLGVQVLELVEYEPEQAELPF